MSRIILLANVITQNLINLHCILDFYIFKFIIFILNFDTINLQQHYVCCNKLFNSINFESYYLNKLNVKFWFFKIWAYFFACLHKISIYLIISILIKSMRIKHIKTMHEHKFCLHVHFRLLQIIELSQTFILLNFTRIFFIF